jgi:hypothetical protein
LTGHSIEARGEASRQRRSRTPGKEAQKESKGRMIPMIFIRPFRAPTDDHFHRGFALAFGEMLHPRLISIVPPGLQYFICAPVTGCLIQLCWRSGSSLAIFYRPFGTRKCSCKNVVLFANHFRYRYLGHSKKILTSESGFISFPVWNSERYQNWIAI